MMGWLGIVLVGMVTGEWEPVRADLSTSRWFPPITKQLDESCAQQAGIYYLLSYELNRARNQSASEARYRYAAHFPWQFVNEGRDRGSELVDGWLIAKEMGIPSEKTYGGPRALGEWM